MAIIYFLQDLDETLCIESFCDDDAKECYLQLQSILFLLNIDKINAQYEEKITTLDVSVLVDKKIEFGTINFVLDIRRSLINFVSDIYSFSSDVKFNYYNFSDGKKFDKYIEWSADNQTLLMKEAKEKAEWR